LTEVAKLRLRFEVESMIQEARTMC